MLVTMTPIDRPEWAFMLVDGPEHHPFPDAGLVWGLQREGLEGWYEPAEPVMEDMPNLPDGDGRFWPEGIHLDSRLLTVRGVVATLRQAGSISIAAALDRLSWMVGRAVEVAVDDAAGRRVALGYVSAAPVLPRVSETVWTFSLIVTLPDPIKYGREMSVTASGGAVALVNEGTADVPFTVVTTGRTRALSVSYGGRIVSWVGDSATGVIIDMADGVPRNPAGAEVGSLIYADKVRVPPGSHSVQVSSDGSASVRFRSGWL